MANGSTEVEMLALSTQDFQMMKNQFYEVYIKALESSLSVLMKLIKERLRAIKFMNVVMNGATNMMKLK